MKISDSAQSITAIVNAVARDLPSMDRTITTLALLECHTEAQPLRLADMAEAAADGNEGRFYPSLIHDVAGIVRNYNPSTRRLDNFFMPRFSAHSTEEAQQ